MDIAIMIEDQNGLNWPRWQRLAKAVEALGFMGLYRSDHYTNAQPPDKDSLELWVSLTWLATHTEQIEFGPLVSPVSFRHPTMTARMAAAVDDLSNGRLSLGLGAGWQEREHTNYGWDLLSLKERFDRFEEGVEIISHLLQNEKPLDYDGQYYQLKEAAVLPPPRRPGGPPITIGGNGPKRTLPLVARYATEWNALFIGKEAYSMLNQKLDELLKENGRAPQTVRRSIMTGCLFGKDEEEVNAKLTAGNRTIEEMRARGMVVGTGNQIVDQLGEMGEAGVERVMLQWIDLDDLDGLEALAKDVVRQI